MTLPSETGRADQPLLPRPHLVFAQLVPTNIEAQRLFGELAEVVLSNTTNPELAHCAKFLHIETYAPLPTTRQARGASLESRTTTDTDDENPLNTIPKYQGGHILSFEENPLNAKIGWVIGFGRRSKKQNAPLGMVDILLAKPGTSSARFGVAGKHAHLFFDKDAVLTLRVLGSRGTKTAIGNDEFDTGKRNITARKSRVSFGSLCYNLEFCDLEQDAYNSALRNYVQANLEMDFPSLDISAAPSPMDYVAGDWNIRGTVGTGSFGVVNIAKHVKTGETGAVKCFVRNSIATHVKILREIDTLKELPRNPRLLFYITALFERGERWYTGVSDESDERYHLQTRPEKVYLIYGPVVRFTLAEKLVLTQALPKRISAFYQVLQGILALHDKGFIHRDIKPANIGVVKDSANAIEVVILDYGETVRSQHCEPRPGKVGTIPFLAPEMEQQLYRNGVDIWAAGITGLQLFVSEGKLWWGNVVNNEAAWKRQMALLQQAPANHIENLLAAMLIWEPSDRVAADAALKHPCFDIVRAAYAIEEDVPEVERMPEVGSKRKHA